RCNTVNCGTLIALSNSALVFFVSSRRRHTRSKRDWSSDVCSSDLSDSSEETGNKKQTDDKEEYWDGGMFNDLYKQFMGEVNKYVNSDKINEKYKGVNEKANKTYKDVRNKFDNSQQASQLFKSVEKAFDSVKTTNFDSMFAGGAKNR